MNPFQTTVFVQHGSIWDSVFVGGIGLPQFREATGDFYHECGSVARSSRHCVSSYVALLVLDPKPST